MSSSRDTMILQLFKKDYVQMNYIQIIMGK